MQIMEYIALSLVALSVLTMLVAYWQVRPYLRGLIGGWRVEKELQKLRDQGAAMMQGVTLPLRNGELCHIDYLIVRGRQVVAVMLLGHDGEISGSMRDALWSSRKGKENQRFANPLRHHEKVKQAIEAMLGSKQDVRVCSVFTGGELHVSDMSEVMTAEHFERSMDEWLAETRDHKKQDWAVNLFRQISIRSHSVIIDREHSFTIRQSNQEQVQRARYSLYAGIALMLAALLTALLHLYL